MSVNRVDVMEWVQLEGRLVYNVYPTTVEPHKCSPSTTTFVLTFVTLQ